MTDVIKTRAQLIERAGINLGLVQPGEALAPEDYSTLDNLFDPLLAQLSALGIIYVSNPDEIETEIFMPLAACLANQAGPSFGSPINDDAWRRDTSTLRQIAAAGPTYEPMKVEYF